MHYFSNLFWYRTLHVSGRFTVHHQYSSTVYTAQYLSYRLCWMSASEVGVELHELHASEVRMELHEFQSDLASGQSA